MAVFRPFKALRPLPEYADKVAALPYDVMNSEEAAQMVTGNPYSFLHVDKAEIDLPAGTDLYADEVYAKAAENLRALEQNGICAMDETPCFYIYRLVMNGRSQTGIMGCVSIDDYADNIIKKHELTLHEKEIDRIKHVDTCDANTGPIYLTHRKSNPVSEFITDFKEKNEPVYDFTADTGVRHTVWVVSDKKDTDNITKWFKDVQYLYIADGHHRAASAVHVGMQRRQENPGYTGSEEFNFFLAVLFSCDELKIFDYNRVIKDLNGMTPAEFIEKTGDKFIVEKANCEGPYRPEKVHTFGMFLGGEWYKLTAKPGTFDESDPVAALDVSVLQNNLIAPVLGITDPRKDGRIDFVGGIRGLGELEKRAKTDMCLAFAMYPTSLYELLDVADAGKIMPPKSTWFEPKPLSGLFIHKLS
jgi:uncharacterized protein (DUF1015 family)